MLDDAVLKALLPPDGLLFFSAVWDGNSQNYRPVVREAAGKLGRQVVELDVDDAVGGAIASAYSILNTPAIATGLPGRGRVVIGARDAGELVSMLTQ